MGKKDRGLCFQLVTFQEPDSESNMFLFIVFAAGRKFWLISAICFFWLLLLCLVSVKIAEDFSEGQILTGGN